MATDHSDLIESVTGYFGGGSTVSSCGRDGGGTLWATYYDGVQTDLAEVNDWYNALPDMLREAGGKLQSARDAMIKWINERAGQAATTYSQFLGSWNGTSGLMTDIGALAEIDGNTDRWENDVWSPIRHDATTTAREAKLLQNWSGPGAEAYSQILAKQLAAIVEMQKLAQSGKGFSDKISTAIAGVATAAQTMAKSCTDAIKGVKKLDDPSKLEWYGRRTDIGANNFSTLRTWATGIASDGQWSQGIPDLQRAMEDVYVNSELFYKFTWPEAKADNLIDMTNGKDSNLSQQPQVPAGPGNTSTDTTSTESTTTEETTEVDTEGTGPRDGQNAQDAVQNA